MDPLFAHSEQHKRAGPTMGRRLRGWQLSPERAPLPAATAHGGEPLVTIITVVRNGQALIGKTIESVIKLKGPEVEYIIRDGGSADGTQAIIGRYAGIDVFDSSPDSGIYDAMNEGANSASGTFLLFLNAGDILVSLPLQHLRNAPPHINAMSFPVLIDTVHVFRPKLGWKLRLTNTLHHQGTFYRRNCIPQYDLRYKVFADYELNLGLARDGQIACHVAPIIAMHATDGISNRRESADELFAIILKWYGRFGMMASLAYFKLRGALWRVNIRI
jgi:glycosyltransferase involved in cell wall biosynthesis